MFPRLAALGLLTGAVWADDASAFFEDSTVKEIRIYFDSANWYNTLYQSHASNPDDPYFPARFVYGGTTIPKIGVRFKGFSSFQRNGVKKSFKLDFHEYDSEARFLGMKKLNLNNGDLQPSFMREKMFLDFAGKYMAAMRAVYVRLYVNDVYYGLYIGIEQPDKPMLRNWYGSSEDGNLWEAGEDVAATLSYLGASKSSYTSRYELKTNEEAGDYTGLINFLNILNNTSAAELPAKLEAVCDVDNMLSSIALNVLFTNLESYVGVASEYYLYQRSKDGRFTYIHWDLNETFGSTGDGTPRLTSPATMDLFWLPTASTGGGAPGGGATDRPLMTKLWAVDQYKRRYLRLLAKMLRQGFDYDTVYARQQALANLIRSHVQADPNKPWTNAQFESSLTGTVNTGQMSVLNEAQFVRDRYNYARPILNGYALASDIRLNEVVAVNASGSPWVELHNLGPGPVTLNGFYLSDDAANRTKWALPARTLADGEFLMLYLDGQTAAGETHANFTLNAAGGGLYLYASAISSTTPIDSVTYPASVAGQSYIRLYDHGDTWSRTTNITQGRANPTALTSTSIGSTTGTGELLINEVMADNDGSLEDPDEKGAYEDWFEIYNPGSTAVDMSGMYVTDNLNNPTKFKIPDGVVIPAKGYLVFFADGEPAQGPRHTSWSLSADGEAVGLYRSDGKTLIDSVTFPVQQTDISFGRTTDGASTWTIFSPPTPGAANANGYSNWIVNGASYVNAPIAPASIASAFAENLLDATVSVTDSAGVTRDAYLYFTSAGQVNFQTPDATAAGRAKVTLKRPDGSSLSGDILVQSTAPGLFSANASGQGVGLIAAVTADASGNQTWTPVFTYNAALQQMVATPVNVSGGNVYLAIYCNGVRNAASLSDISVQVGGQKVTAAYAGAQNQYVGLDQINVGPLPASLAGKGEVEVVLTVAGKRTNRVTLTIQ